MQNAMRVLMAVAAFFGSSFLAALAAAPEPSAAMMKPIETQLAAMNAGDPTPLKSLYTGNAIIVDEFAPYTWHGENAGVQWFKDFGKFARAAHISNAHGAILAVKSFDQHGNLAYVVVPATFSGTMDGKEFTEHGSWTFTLQRTGNDWKIATETWGTVSMSM